MSEISLPPEIFCCSSAAPASTTNTKLYHDPNREIHNAILHSFIAFALRRRQSNTLMKLLFSKELSLTSSSSPPETTTPQSSSNPPLQNTTATPPATPPAILTPDALKNNPLTASTPYVIHVTSRYDFGPVYSHRYFVCPEHLELDWKEISLEQWFANGGEFGLKAEKWDFKCWEDGKFFRLELRPNLGLRRRKV